MFQISDANALVAFIKDFTGSTNDAEVKQCIFLAELSMRNVELPGLRSDPYAVENIGVADSLGHIPIPGDMNKPILFFKQGSPGGPTPTPTGPWLVYDRIGDRDIITQGMIAQLYLQPTNVPAVIRGKFSEVGASYQFLPYMAEGDQVNLYYYKAWPTLFSPILDEVISTTGTVGTIAGAGPWTANVTGMTAVGDLEVGDEVYATNGTGSFGGGGITTVSAILGATSISILHTGGTTPTAGTVTVITQTGLVVENNAVLQTWPEGYVYSTLREYYIKRHNDSDAMVQDAKFNKALATVGDQNSLGKWSGGSTRLTSIWQPRRAQQYNVR